MMKKILKKYFQISFGVILIISSLQILPFNVFVITEVSGSSCWTQTSDVDFNTGTLQNVTVISSGSVELLQHTKYIEDDFKDESKISYKNNVSFDTINGEVALSKINKTFGSTSYDCGNSVQQTPDGGYILVGKTSTFLNPNDVWLIKTDPVGKEEWNKVFGGNDYDFGDSVQQTSDGGYIIGGSTWSYGPGQNDFWLIKTDSAGNKQWDKTYGGGLVDVGEFAQQTSDNGYIIVGWTESFGAGGYDVWLIKTDASGNKQWDKTFGGSSDDEGYSVQQTSDGGYIITGETESYGAGGRDVWLIKTDSAGNYQWDKTFGGSGNDDGCTVQQSADGGYIIIGGSYSYGLGIADAWLIKTDPGGNKLWNYTFGGFGWDWGYSVQQTSDYGYIFTGRTYVDDNNGDDAWLVKTNASGGKQWEKTFGGAGGDGGSSVKQTKNGGYILTGATYSYGVGNGDLWLIKTDCYGNMNPVGSLISTNLLESQAVIIISEFNYSVSLPFDTIIKAQFSQDNISWYNSMGTLNGWDFLVDGVNVIDLSPLGWQGPNFYYKLELASDGMNIPIIKKIIISFNKYYFDSGIFISAPHNSGEQTNWVTLSWTATEPTGTDLKFQIRTANTQSELSNHNFLGPDGTAATYYSSAPSSIWAGHNWDVWIQYIAYFSGTSALSPILEEVKIDYNSIPDPPILTAPVNDEWLNYSNPRFEWNFIDLDGTQNGFQILIDDSIEFDSVDYDSGEQNSQNQYWQFPTGTKYPAIKDGIWYWKARTRDNDGMWSPYSSSWSLKIDTTSPDSFTLGDYLERWINDKRPTISFTTTDATSGVEHYEIKIDEYDFAGQDSPHTLPAQSDGVHNLIIRAYDYAGNYREESFELYIDATPPIEFTPVLETSSWSSNSQPRIAFSTIDITSGVDHYELKVDQGEFTIQTSPYILPEQTDDIHAVFIRAYDMAGNYLEVSTEIFIDTEPPKEFIPKITPGGWSSNTQPKISFQSTDITSGVEHYEVKLDNGSFTTRKSPYTFPPLCDGVHNVTVHAIDKAGNYRDANVKIYIDTAPPIIIHTPVKKVKKGSKVTITATVMDNLSGVENVILHYKSKGEFTYLTTVMDAVNNTYSTTLSPDGVTSDLEYYIEASDATSPINIVYFGSDGVTNTEPNSRSDIDISVEQKEDNNLAGLLSLLLLIIAIIVIVVILIWLLFIRKKKGAGEGFPPRPNDHDLGPVYPQYQPQQSHSQHHQYRHSRKHPISHQRLRPRSSQIRTSETQKEPEF